MATEPERARTDPNDPRAGLGDLRIDRGRVHRRRTSIRRVVPIVAILALVAVILAFVFSRPPKVAVAEVREARPGESETLLSATGYVTSERRTVVAPKIPGRLEEVAVKEGERVKAGQLIARLDDDDAKVALRQADADERAARGRVAQAKAALDKATRDRARAEQLYAGGAIDRQSRDDARSAEASARAAVTTAEGQLAAARAARSAAALHLSQTRVEAPFTGTIVKKLADEGAVLAPASITATNVGGIVEMVDLDALEVDAEVSETELSKIARGQPALVFLDAFPDRVFRAKAGSVRPAIDRSKATAVVKVLFDEPPEGALPDMGAKVSFLKAPLDAQDLAHEPRLRVPSKAVTERNGHAVVLTVKDGRVEPAEVEIAERLGDEAVLKTGPAPGTPIVADATGDLHAGERVRVRAEGS
jgi:RND family efflux transporter MFP subunit